LTDAFATEAALRRIPRIARRASVPPLVSTDAVFVNIPYDEGFRRLYLAYIVGLTQLG
jgi:hypothetical protein